MPSFFHSPGALFPTPPRCIARFPLLLLHALVWRHCLPPLELPEINPLKTESTPPPALLRCVRSSCCYCCYCTAPNIPFPAFLPTIPPPPPLVPIAPHRHHRTIAACSACREHDGCVPTWHLISIIHMVGERRTLSSTCDSPSIPPSLPPSMTLSLRLGVA